MHSQRLNKEQLEPCVIARSSGEIAIVWLAWQRFVPMLHFLFWTEISIKIRESSPVTGRVA